MIATNESLAIPSSLTTRRPSARRKAVLLVCGALTLLCATPAAAYIGPGAGFALASSFFVLLTTVVLGMAALLFWPFRTLWRVIRRKRPPKSYVKRLIVVGLDGQDPKITDRLMQEGRLPNFSKLAAEGSYDRIQTTYPALSPVAWSSFSTGANPGKHNIFDFLDRDLRSYLPRLSSTAIGRLEKFLKVGKFRIPLHKPELRLLRKSKPFWSILGEHNIWSTILRVPITFPPDKFYGAQLAAMCVPDLLGSQGTFQLFTTRPSSGAFKEGGLRVELSANGSGPDHFAAAIQGPENTFRVDEAPMEIPLEIDVDRSACKATVHVDGEAYTLEEGKLSPWIPLSFKAVAGMRVQGLCRMQLTETQEHLSLYVTPLNISPQKPAMPLSHPSYYAPYLAKKVGDYATLGLAEDTWALNEKVTDDSTFLEQTYDIEDEREEMFFAALERLRKGSLVCVFDGTDRIQHMFWRYTEEGHPADDAPSDAPHRNAIEELYERNDALIGRVVEKLRDGDLLMVLSDHGFASFRRGVNLNRWLLDNGYLTLKDGADGTEEWLAGVDWSKTKAYALGLSGLFLNVKGREAQGIVEPGAEAAALRKEIAAKLHQLPDEEHDAIGINEAFDAADIYDGPYARSAPDLVIGFNDGYRTSWDAATGMVSCPLFEDNVKAWSGDHCVDPRLVPGIFFCSKKIHRDDPSLLDIAPTALQLFGLEKPGFMEGTPLFEADKLEEAFGTAR